MEQSEKVFLDYIHDKDLNQSEKDILSYLIQKKFKSQQLSIRKAAGDLFVSTTSIIRVCKKLGFSGYSEITYNLGLKVTKMIDSESESVAGIHGPYEENLKEFSKNFKLTFEATGEKNIEGFLYEIERNKMVYFYGAGFSTLFSNYLAKKLELFGYYVSNTSTSDSRAIFFNNKYPKV
jgi:DNA-binding MurR/RpiR family transcriptional regulator